ncbi:MAG: FAD:protein FMN transferase [Clostridiales bacterium]|nr:FAD:protein FMN transferase [Clostridiales bacterium]
MRLFRSAGAVLACLCLLCCLWVPSQAEVQRYTANFSDVFDTVSQLVIYSDSQEDATALAQKAYSLLRYYHQLFDIYNDHPKVVGVYELNQRAADSPVQVEQELFDLLVFAKEMYTLTNGNMNIAMGSVLRIWHHYREQGLQAPQAAQLPPIHILEEAAPHTSLDQVILDETNRSVFFADPLLKLDLGAIAKGYAVERVADALAADGATGVLLSIGGNVRAIGLRPDGTAFTVGVQNPDLEAAQQNLRIVGLSDASLVTSGSYQRFYTVNGTNYHHIIDQDTLMPAQHVWAVSVITEDSGVADALSTALFNMPLEEGLALVAGLPQVEALWVKHDGSVVVSDGFSSLEVN